MSEDTVLKWQSRLVEGNTKEKGRLEIRKRPQNQKEKPDIVVGVYRTYKPQQQRNCSIANKRECKRHLSRFAKGARVRVGRRRGLTFLALNFYSRTLECSGALCGRAFMR
jgi:hypothetical protein